MPSLIDPSVPVAGVPTTASVRGNFATAAAEITALQLGLLPLAATRAALRATAPPAAVTSILELGYTTPGDKEPRLWCWDPGSTAADDNGSAICPDGHPIGTPGRWTLGPDNGGCVDLVDFGPVGQGYDDAPAMGAALATGYNVRLPAATLNFNSQQASGIDVFLVSSHDQYIIGSGMVGSPAQAELAGTIIASPLAGCTIFHFQGAAACGIKDVSFDCPAMTDGWCIYLDGCGPEAIVERINGIKVPGLIAVGPSPAGGPNKVIHTDHLRIASSSGGSVALLDGTVRSLRAICYGWNFVVAATNNGPWFGRDWIFGTGPDTPSVHLLLDGYVNSTNFSRIRFNSPDVGVALINSQGIGSNPALMPQFTYFDDLAIQTPDCTIFPAGGYFNSGNVISIGKYFCNASGGDGLFFGASTSNIRVNGIQIDGCDFNCLHIAGNQIVVRDGLINNCNNANGGPSTYANIQIGANADDVTIDGIMQLGTRNPGYDLMIAPSATHIWLSDNSWTGGQQSPTLIADPGYCGWYTPAIRSAFNPTFAFATPGDSVWTYTVQFGRFWQDGDFYELQIQLTATVAYTTASGSFIIGGIPVAAGANANGSSCPIGKWNHITLDAGYTDVTALILGNTITLFENGSTKGTLQLSTANVPSGPTNIAVQVRCRYQSS